MSLIDFLQFVQEVLRIVIIANDAPGLLVHHADLSTTSK